MKTRKLEDIIEMCHVRPGKKFRLKDIDPGDTGPFVGEAKKEAKRQLGEHMMGALAVALRLLTLSGRV